MEEALAVAEKIWGRPERSLRTVMIGRSEQTPHKTRQVTLYKDKGGLYVRLGRHGKNKTYLKTMHSAKIVSHEHHLVLFYV